MRIRLVLLIISIHLFCSSFGQQLVLTKRDTKERLALKLKKVRSLVTMDGEFLEGRLTINGDLLQIDGMSLELNDIGIVEVRKGSFKKTATFPLKLLGISSGVAGAIMTSAYVSDEENVDPAAGIAGLALLGVGAGSLILSKKAEPSKSSLIRSFHVRDWIFSLE